MKNAATRVRARRNERMRGGTAASNRAQAANSGSENTAIMPSRASHTPCVWKLSRTLAWRLGRESTGRSR